MGDFGSGLLNVATLGLVGDGPFSGSEPETQQVAEVQNLTPSQQRLLNDIIGQVQGLNLSQPIPGASPLQRQAFTSAGTADFTQEQDALSRLLSGERATVQRTETPLTTSGDVNEFFNKAFRQPALQSFTQDILPQIQESFIGQNAGSSGAANRAITRGFTDVQSNLDAQLANLLFNTEQANLSREFTAGESFASRDVAAQENALNRLLQGIPQGINLTNAPVNLGLLAGGTQRDISLSQNPQFSPLFSTVPALLGTSAVPTPVFQQTAGTQSLGSQLLPAIGSIASLF